MLKLHSWKKTTWKKLELDHFLGKGFVESAPISADADCCALGWPGLKGQTVNYLFEEFLPDLRKAGVGKKVLEQLLVHYPSKILTMQEPR